MRTHLFVAPGSAAFGEVLLGLRLARELHAQGDRALFLAPAAHHLLFAGTPFSHGAIEPVAAVLDQALPSIVRERGADTVVLLDLLLVLLALGQRRIDPAFLDALPVPTFALDIWDLRRSDLVFDMCEAELVLPAAARTLVPRRLVPVPFARPDSAGAYNALPSLASDEARELTRARLGVGDDERLVLVTTAQFQDRGLTPFQQRAVKTVPPKLVADCLASDPRVRVIHVGPRAVVTSDARYAHHHQVAPAEFTRIVAAADLLVTANQAATGISTALALGVPALAVIGESTEQRFRMFPLGLHRFMAPALAGNPYTDAVRAVDVNQLQAAVALALFDPGEQARQAAATAAYVEAVRALPEGRSFLDLA